MEIQVHFWPPCPAAAMQREKLLYIGRGQKLIPVPICIIPLAAVLHLHGKGYAQPLTFGRLCGLYLQKTHADKAMEPTRSEA
eukprot:633611-Pelagomonas_calceolata.AAC.2